MTSSHPHRETLERFRLGTLAGRELLDADDHLRDCALCRHAVRPPAQAVRASRAALETLDGEHLSFEEMLRHVDGSGDPEERNGIELHLDVCPMCRGEVDDLAAVTAAVAPPRTWSGLHALAAVLAGIVAGGAALFWTADRRGPAPAPAPVEIAGGSTAEVPDVLLPATVEPPEPGWVVSDPMKPLPPSLRRVAAALEDGTLRSVALVASLQGTAGRERSPGETERDLPAVLEPVGAVVEDDRPTFRWSRAASGAEGRVQVFDGEYNRVLESPPVAGTSWQSSAALKRGVTYQWQVVLRTAAGDTTVPKAPDPPARFQVLNANAVAELQAARRSGAKLEEGLICMREGLFDEGARLLGAVAGEHPGTPVVALAERARKIAGADSTVR